MTMAHIIFWALSVTGLAILWLPVGNRDDLVRVFIAGYVMGLGAGVRIAEVLT